MWLDFKPGTNSCGIYLTGFQVLPASPRSDLLYRALLDGIPPLYPKLLQPRGLGCSALYNLTILVACSFVPLGLLAAVSGPLSFPSPLPAWLRVLTTLDSPNVLASGYTLPLTKNTLPPPSYLGAVKFLFLSISFFIQIFSVYFLARILKFLHLKKFFFFFFF